MKEIKYILECILNLIYFRSDVCLCCGKKIYSEEYLCSNCKDKIVQCHRALNIKKEYSFDCYSYAYYSSTIKKLILNMKYKNDFKSVEFLSDLIFEKIIKCEIKADIITFVPSSKSRKRERGYNQSEALCYYLARKLKLKKKELILKKEGAEDQIGLGDVERWENVKDIFYFNRKYDIKEKNIILIDDVLTTGATVYNCYKILKENGSGEVNVFTVAKNIG